MMNKKLKHSYTSIILLCSALFSGSSYSDNKSFEYGPFIASYYMENDGRIAGQGSDGSDLNIISELIASEITPSFN